MGFMTRACLNHAEFLHTREVNGHISLWRPSADCEQAMRCGLPYVDPLDPWSLAAEVDNSAVISVAGLTLMNNKQSICGTGSLMSMRV